MPRRNYNSRAKRPNPRPLELAFAGRHTKPKPAPAVDLDGFPHRPGCAAPSVVTFHGKYGDQMARCRTCDKLTQLDSTTTERND